MSNFIIAVIAGAFVLGILILLHEWGHFVAAKLCGVRVDVFSIGFGTRLWGFKRGTTDYRLSALPLGGYVKMAGDNPVEERTGAPDEFLSRPRWQRFFIAVAGPIANIALTFAIFWGIYAIAGMPSEVYLHKPAEVAAIPQNSSANSGVQPGDRITEVNGVETPTWENVLSRLDGAKPGDSVKLDISRNGAHRALTVKIPDKPAADRSDIAGYPALPPAIEDVQPAFPAERAGMKAGDTVISIDGKPVVTWPQLTDAIRGSEGHPIHFVVRRNGRDVPLTITPTHTMTPDGEMAWLIGASRQAQTVYAHQGGIASVREAGGATWLYTRLIGDFVGGLFSGKVSMHDLAGPVGIVQLSGEAAKRGPLTLLQWIAYISLDLGLLNLLPIPILDGGHVLMLAIEGALRRDLSIAFKERFVQVGLVFLLGIFAFAMYSDILRVIQSR